MANWFRKYFQVTVNIIIDMEKYVNECKTSWAETVEHFRNKNQELLNFKLDIERIKNLLDEIGYPNTQYIISNIDHKEFYDIYRDLYNWSKNQKLNSEQYSKFFEVTKQLRNHIDKNDKYEFTDEQAQKESEKVINLTTRYMNIIKSKIENITKIFDDWSASPITIKPNVSFYMNRPDFTKPATSATVALGNDDFAPSFSLFFHGQKIDVDDILESGDTDFFTSSNIQNDYFRLIKELKNPGSSKKVSKKLVLYTARPKKDRETYINASSIPSNIFLAKDYNTAEGYALEFRDRDIWKVTIEERYLIQTNDYPKEYQTIGSGSVPVFSLKLLYVAD